MAKSEVFFTGKPIEAKSEQFATLRREVEAGLSRIEEHGLGLDEAAVQLVKIGLVLSLATSGPEATLDGLVSQFEQLSAEFPREAELVKAARSFPAVKGSA